MANKGRSSGFSDDCRHHNTGAAVTLPRLLPEDPWAYQMWCIWHSTGAEILRPGTVHRSAASRNCSSLIQAMTCSAKSPPEKLKLQGGDIGKFICSDACFQQEGGLIALTGSPQYVSSIFVILSLREERGVWGRYPPCTSYVYVEL